MTNRVSSTLVSYSVVLLFVCVPFIILIRNQASESPIDIPIQKHLHKWFTTQKNSTTNISHHHQQQQQQQTNSKIYNQTFANRSLLFAYASYCDQNDIQNWTCKWCQYLNNITDITVQTSADTNLLSFTCYDKQEQQIVIVFRGSHNTYDFYQDLRFEQVSYPGIKGGTVHLGFYQSWTLLAPAVMSNVSLLYQQYSGNVKSILITGHSMGAAMAQLCALNVSNLLKSENVKTENIKNGSTSKLIMQNIIYIAREDKDSDTDTDYDKDRLPIEMYTFGSPRWGNGIMANYFNSIVDFHWRLVNMMDIAPLLPPQTSNVSKWITKWIKTHWNETIEYHHTATQIWYTSDEPLQYIQCDGSGEDPECAYEISIWQLKQAANDHLMYLNMYEECGATSQQETRVFADEF